MAKDKTPKEEPKAAPKSKFTKMYWPYSKKHESGETRIFGHKAEENKAGHMEVMVPTVQVKNELKRAKPLLSKKKYDAMLALDAVDDEEDE